MKIIFIVLGSIVATFVALVLLFIGYWWWTSRKQPPAHGLIMQKYYVCRSQKALHGGIFGKGPTKRFFQPGARQWCWRGEWEEIDLDEFKLLATQWYGIDWNNEGEWWQRSSHVNE